MAIAWVMTVYTLNFNYLSYMSIKNSENYKIKKKMGLKIEKKKFLRHFFARTKVPEPPYLFKVSAYPGGSFLLKFKTL